MSEPRTLFLVSEEQLERLYQRFKRLDKDGSGTLSKDEFLAIPEFAMNPLAPRVLAVLQSDQMSSERQTMTPPAYRAYEGEISIDFPTFAKTLGVFSGSATLDQKLAFVFRIYDRSDQGVVSKEDLFELIHTMAGDHLEPNQVSAIVEDILEEIQKTLGLPVVPTVITLEIFKKVHFLHFL